MSEVRGLYAITDPELIPGDTLISACEAALRGGARVLQYRDKHAGPAQRLERAGALAALCREYDALLLINDDARLARDSGAGGVHLGQHDDAISEARQMLGPDSVIGVSCHGEAALARRAWHQGADYVALGRFFPSRTKPDAPPAGLEVLRRVSAELPLPVVAIGGINPDNAALLIRAGARAIAVIHGLFAAPDIEARARSLAAGFALRESDTPESTDNGTFGQVRSPAGGNCHAAGRTEGEIMSRNRSEELFRQASEVIPGGVNSPVRAFAGVGGTPVFFRRGEGPFLFDEDDNRYIDYVGSWGPLILGHCDPDVMAAVRDVMERGLSFGAPTELETRMGQRIRQLVPSMDRVRMVNSGTEATMSAIRLARGYTGRSRIIKFTGCYHGHVDSLMVQAGSGALTLGVPGSPGIPEAVTADTITLPFNDTEAVAEAFRQYGEEVAAVIVEPVAGNMNCVPPVNGFLESLREQCDEHGATLIFDEVMTGFRVAAGGAQAHYGVTPDLTTLGKVVGGGMPVGAFGGRRAIMEYLAPVGPVYQAGTLAGNPVAMAAGLATLEKVAQPGFHERLAETTRQLTQGLEQAARKQGVALTTSCAGGMFGLFFTEQSRVTSLEEVKACDMERFGRFFHAMLDRGIYLAPAAFEAGFVSSAHGDAEIGETLERAGEALATL